MRAKPFNSPYLWNRRVRAMLARRVRRSAGTRSYDPARGLHLTIRSPARRARDGGAARSARSRSEEHTSELQSRENLVCRLLLEKKKSNNSRSAPRSRAVVKTHQ